MCTKFQAPRDEYTESVREGKERNREGRKGENGKKERKKGRKRKRESNFYFLINLILTHLKLYI